MRVPRSPNSPRRRRARKPVAALAGGTLALGLIAGGAVPASAAARRVRRRGSGWPPGPRLVPATWLTGSVKHVIYLQFDNVHYTRDNPNVPSDLEQMPNLLSFITGSGTLLSQEHTPLIAHTADDIVTSESGLYPSDQGLAVANEYQYYTGAANGGTDEAGDFAYWTDPIVDYDTGLASTPVGDSTTNLVGPERARRRRRRGCPTPGRAATSARSRPRTPSSRTRRRTCRWCSARTRADAKEAENPSNAGQAKAVADYEGLSVHCALGSAVCAKYHSVADKLPDEPGGYTGYKALFGAKYIDPLLSPSGPVKNLERRGHQGLQRQRRVPRLRRDDRAERARLHAGHADARRAGHVHLPVRRARLVDHGGGPRPGLGDVRVAAEAGERGVRHVLRRPRRARHHQGEHAVRGHRGRGRPLRRRRAVPGQLQRRHDPVHLQDRRRGGREPDRHARRQGRHDAVRRRRPTPRRSSTCTASPARTVRACGPWSRRQARSPPTTWRPGRRCRSSTTRPIRWS